MEIDSNKVKSKLDDNSKELISIKLKLDEILTDEEKNLFWETLDKYLTDNRIPFNTFLHYLDSTRILYVTLLHFSLKDMIKAIMISPSIIHSSKNDLYDKYLILAKISPAKDLSGRDDIFLNHPTDLRIGINTLYSRIMFLLDIGILSKNITRNKLLKITNEEFVETYNISKETLINRYPFDKKALDKVKNWPENKEFLQMGESKHEKSFKI